MRIEIVMAEFGESRFNNGDASLPGERLEPSLSSFFKHFPEATAKVYTDQPWLSTDRITFVRVDPPFDRKHGRFGNRANDWAQAHGLLQSQADVAIAIDSDLLVVSNRVRALIPLAMTFGLCMPVNGRHLVYRDARSDCDGGRVDDETAGASMCHCTALWAFGTKRGPSDRQLLEQYCEFIQYDAQANRGARGPLSLWRAQWETGITPYTLPSHYCVTGSNLWVPADDAIVLHVGHAEVVTKYSDLIARQR